MDRKEALLDILGVLSRCLDGLEKDVAEMERRAESNPVLFAGLAESARKDFAEVQDIRDGYLDELHQLEEEAAA